MKICWVASSGGHWEELICLQSIMNKYDSVVVTETGGQIDGFPKTNIYTFSQINRKEKKFLVKFVSLFIYAYKIMRKEKPDIVITTGALLSFPFCLLGKIMRKKIIYIESFARVEKRSMTGRMVYPLADLFIVQWETLLKLYPKAIYGGGIF